MKTIKQILLFALIVNIYACKEVSIRNEQSNDQSYEYVGVTSARSLIIGGTEVKLNPDEFVSWKCTDYPYGYKTLIEVGRISYDHLKKQMYENYKNDDEYNALNEDEKKEINEKANELIKMFGFIIYDGTDEGDAAFYHRRGLNHRWDWGEERQYSFVIKPNGIGLFYDFSTVENGMKSKADGVYECRK